MRAVGDRRRGYGTRTARQTMERLKKMGVNTIGVLMDGRMTHTSSPEVRLSTRDDLEATRQALLDANAMGLATILVPHLYLDDGQWRGRIRFDDQKTADAWWTSYGAFIHQAASVAQASGASALSVGVELKAISKDQDTYDRMAHLVSDIRKVYGGKLTYSANWDEAEQVVFWPLLDLVGVNGYYPLVPDVVRGAQKVSRRLDALAQLGGRDVLIMEVGYRSSPLSHEKPWSWPDQVEAIVDHRAQAHAWASVLTHWMEAPRVRGLMVWVIPTDPDDPASEPPHGFNPLNKPAESVIARVFLGESQDPSSGAGAATSAP